MTLNASGPISLGGTTAGQSAEVELGGTGTAAITMNDSNLRTLAAVGGSGAQWSMNSLYGKSNTPATAWWAWGNNTQGQLGVGAPLSTGFSSPVQVGSVTTWSNIYAGAYSTYSIKSDGTMWITGQNGYGSNAGLGSVSTPVQLGTLTNWKTVSAGHFVAASIKTDGTLWGWGNNAKGSLGQGTTTATINSPVQIGVATTWASVSVSDTSNAGNHLCAIKQDGTLWGCGYNTSGQLGNGTTLNVSTLIQLGSAFTWSKVAANSRTTLMIRSDGSLWGCGYNYYSQVGTGVFGGPNLSSPARALGSQVWASVAVNINTALAIDTSGKLWACGYNGYGTGILGISAPSGTSVSTFVQVGSLTNWAVVAMNNQTAMAIKTDGTLWAWGTGGGSIGNGTANKYSSPIQIGSLTTWKSISTGGAQDFVALKS